MDLVNIDVFNNMLNFIIGLCNYIKNFNCISYI